jgi:hypothetical protein
MRAAILKTIGLVLGGVSLFTGVATAADKPNIVVIMGDDEK